MRLVSSIPKVNAEDLNKTATLNKNDILHIYDVFDVDTIEQICNEKGIPGIIVSDHITYFKNLKKNVKFVGLPLWLEQERKQWNLTDFLDNRLDTNYCFNFMINKKQINRYLCIKLVELYKFKHFSYTWSGVDNYFDCADIINEQNTLGKNSPLTTKQFSNILSPIKLKPVFFKKAGIVGNKDNVSIANFGGIRVSWDLGLDKMFKESAVSLITESLIFQKASVFTEKTLYSVLGLNFPIWVGGYRQADSWKDLGFDTFDDVINHDYQCYDSLLERCVYAFVLNKRILTDLDYARSIREKHIKRLENNRRLILSGKLSEYIKKELENHFSTVKNLDDSVKDSLSELLKYFTLIPNGFK